MMLVLLFDAHASQQMFLKYHIVYKLFSSLMNKIEHLDEHQFNGSFDRIA